MSDAHEADGPRVLGARVDVRAYFLTLDGVILGVRIGAVSVVVLAVHGKREIRDHSDALPPRAREGGANAVGGAGGRIVHVHERQIARRLDAEQILPELRQRAKSTPHLPTARYTTQIPWS